MPVRSPVVGPHETVARQVLAARARTVPFRQSDSIYFVVARRGGKLCGWLLKLHQSRVRYLSFRIAARRPWLQICQYNSVYPAGRGE